MEVGIRELKAELSRYVSKAAAGHDVTITDRGRPVARIVPIAVGPLTRGIDEGWVDPPRRTRLEPFTPLQSDAAVLDVLDDDRG